MSNDPTPYDRRSPMEHERDEALAKPKRDRLEPRADGTWDLLRRACPTFQNSASGRYPSGWAKEAAGVTEAEAARIVRNLTRKTVEFDDADEIAIHSKPAPADDEGL